MKRTIGTRDIYKSYKKEVENPVSTQDYLDISQGFVKFCVDLLMEGETITLPERMGTYFFVGDKTRPYTREDGSIGGLSPNWKATNELWEKKPEAKKDKIIVYHFNEHSNGIRYRFHWSKKRIFVKNKDFYAFRLTRGNKRRFRELLLEGKEFFVRQRKEMYYGRNN